LVRGRDNRWGGRAAWDLAENSVCSGDATGPGRNAGPPFSDGVFVLSDVASGEVGVGEGVEVVKTSVRGAKRGAERAASHTRWWAFGR